MRSAALALVLLAALPGAAAARAGDLDRGFGRAGSVSFALGPDASAATAVALGGFGRVVVGGSEAGGRLVVARLTSSGRRDRRFGRRGVALIELPSPAPGGVRGLEVFRDGRVVIAATLEPAFGPARIVVARLLPDGELDPGFGTDGVAVVGPPEARAGSLALTREGVIVVGGGIPTDDGADTPLVLRLLPDGEPDPGFAEDGAWSGAEVLLRGWARDLLAGPDGEVTFALGGAPRQSGPSPFGAARLTAAGALDPAFGVGAGYVLLPGGDDGGAAGIVRGPGGRVVIAGTVEGRGGAAAGLARLLPDGALDPRFGRGGAVRHQLRRGLRIAALARTRAGHLVLAGRTAAPRAAVLRLRANGRPDGAFGRRGYVVRVLGTVPAGRRTLSAVAALAAEPRGRVLAAGTVADANRIARDATGRRHLMVARLRG